MSRRSAGDTRKLLIDVGIEILHERGANAGVGHIKLSEVVSRAGLTTGAACRLWDDQADFHRELAAAALRWRDAGSIEGTVRKIVPVLQRGAPFDEVLRVGAEANVHNVSADAAFLTTLALRASAFGDAELQEESHRRHVEATAAYAELYQGVLVRYRRTMRPPFTVHHVAPALAALAEGFSLQAISGDAHPHLELPPRDPEVGNDWTLLGLASRAIIDHFTMPQGGEGPSGEHQPSGSVDASAAEPTPRPADVD